MNREFLVFDPGLIEEAVFAALRGRPEQRDYGRERDRIYEIADSEERERRFDALARRWFAKFRLGDGVAGCLEEQPAIRAGVRCCVVVRAALKKEQGAELFVSPDPALGERDKRTVRLLLCPETLLDRRELVPFLRRELYHVADMIDPAFEYEPVLPPATCGPTHDALLRERYRALWEITIEGRMSRRGWAPASARSIQRDRFARMFPALGNLTEDRFRFFFDFEPHTHRELVAFAREPDHDLRQAADSATPRGHRCPLCGFPTHAFEPRPEALSETVKAAIVEDFSEWRPELGLCLQCADLYRAAALSRSEAMLLPGSVFAESRRE